MTSLSDVLAALDHLGGRERVPGAGVVLDHCAQSIECSLSGYPVLKPAWLRATIGRLVKRRFLARGAMKHNTGAGLPGMPALAGESPVPAALDRLRSAIGAFRAHVGQLAPHPVFGTCTRDEYEQLHAMHVANHLSALE